MTSTLGSSRFAVISLSRAKCKRLQTVKTVFQDHSLPDRTLYHRDEYVDCSAIKQTALMTVEGEKDDICGLGQTGAAHDLCSSIPERDKVHYVQLGVGHYGVFNGTRWRTEIQPRIKEFIRTLEFRRKEQAAEMRGLMGYLTGGNKVAAKEIAAPVSERLSERPAERLKVKANGHLKGMHAPPVVAGE